MEIHPTAEMLTWAVMAAAAAMLALIFTQSRHKAATTRRIPPGPPGWPILGNILDLVGFKPHRTLVDFKNKYGPLVWLRLGSVNTLVICSAEAAMEMFKNHDHSTCNRHLNETLKIGGSYTGTITLSEYGPYWRMLRRLCATELFSRKRINDTAPLRRRCVDKLMKWISDEAKEQSDNGVELARYVFATSFNVIGNLMLSRDLVDPKSSKGNEFFNLTSELTELTGKPNISDFFPILRWFDLQGLKRQTEAKQVQVLDIVGSFVEGRRRQDIEGKQSHTKEQKDFLDVLMEFKAPEKTNQLRFQIEISIHLYW
ncbi:hypothetical protein MKW92_018653 [Papaver armeniacum]|nr:hypothetical protein MKW92_018653 [Papaver armeniacum]